MKTIVIGVGNPIKTDDSVGIAISRILAQVLAHRSDIDVAEVYAGGLRLADKMTGYDRVIVIDSIVTRRGEPGDICRLTPLDMVRTRNTICVHDMDLLTALNMGRALGVRVPSDVQIWGIEAMDVESFGEDLTEPVATAVPKVVKQIVELVGPPPVQEYEENIK